MKRAKFTHTRLPLFYLHLPLCSASIDQHVLSSTHFYFSQESLECLHVLSLQPPADSQQLGKSQVCRFIFQSHTLTLGLN